VTIGLSNFMPVSRLIMGAL